MTWHVGMPVREFRLFQMAVFSFRVLLKFLVWLVLRQNLVLSHFQYS